MRRIVAVACLSLAVAGLFAQLSAAAFTGSTAIPSNAVTVDELANYFSVVPGSAVQPGTSTSVASGGVDNLALDFGTVPSARTFTSVFRVTNVSGATRTATLTLSNVAQVSSVVFASSGGGSATLASGASTAVTVTTSSTVAGRGSGTLRLALSGISWLYRDYSFGIDEAPEAPGAPSAVQKPAGRLDLSWTASSTVTNLAGYDVYRSSGGAYAKLNAVPLTGLSYSDTATTDGTAYTYKVRAVSSGTPVLDSLDSTTVTATADASAPGTPSSFALANGGGNGTAYVNAGNAGSLSVSITLPADSLASDVVQLTISNGGSSVVTTRAGRRRHAHPERQLDRSGRQRLGHRDRDLYEGHGCSGSADRDLHGQQQRGRPGRGLGGGERGDHRHEDLAGADGHVHDDGQRERRVQRPRRGRQRQEQRARRRGLHRHRPGRRRQHERSHDPDLQRHPLRTNTIHPRCR